MAYTTINKPQDYFNTKLYSGTGSSQAITGVGFQPDWTWIKQRTGTQEHWLVDSVRGTTKFLESNSGNAESSDGATGFTSFDSDGFTVNTSARTNASSNTYASWNWLAGTSVSGNTGGSGTAKTYSGSVNTTAGFSIIKFTGNGTAGHTIPHHLGVAPKMILVKNLTSASTNWQTYHYGLDDGAGTHEVFLDTTAASNASSGAWNNTAPTSTVITKGTGSYGNENNSSHIMYSFAEKKGYSKFGKYFGNSSTDGTFIYTGFKPAWFMQKRTDATNGWHIFDLKRDTHNVSGKYLTANQTSTEPTGTYLDILSNGIKMRRNGADVNQGTYIYMAFAEAPTVGSNNVPATAR